MTTNLYICLRSRIEKGCYLFDVMLQEYKDKIIMSETTIGTIVTRTMETGDIPYTYSFAGALLNLFEEEQKELIEKWCSFAQEETKRLNDFFETEF